MASKLKELLSAIDAHRNAVTHLLADLPDDVVEGLIMFDAIEKVRTTQEEVIRLRNGMTEGWEEVAVYLADCEAATTEDLAGVKGQKYQTKRHMEICETMAQSLTHEALINKRPSDKERVIERLRGAIESSRKKLEKK